jgi:hypothetical protein
VVRREAAGIFSFVTRNVVLRTIAALTGLAVSLAGPASALSHALEHERSAHAHAHEDLFSDGADAREHDPDRPASASHITTAPEDEHPHALLDAGRAVRVGAHVTPAIPTVVAVSAEHLASVAVAHTDPVEALIVATATGPPPPTRAPPAI